MRLTFKKDKSEGRFGWVHADSHHTRAYLNGVEFLHFVREPKRGWYRIRIQTDKPIGTVTTDNPCTWQWVTYNAYFMTLDDAKAYVRVSREELYAILATAIKTKIEGTVQK